MKISVIFTGGTIGSLTKDGWITADSHLKSSLPQWYLSKKSNDVEFQVSNPYTILSENLSGSILTNLVSHIEQELAKDNDGIIVLHGTDTLLYSATALFLTFGGETKPIVFVSANTPLENKNTNGFLNFEGAVEFIKQKAGRGTFLCYANDLTEANIYRAYNLLAHMEASHKVFGLKPPFAKYKNGKVLINGDLESDNIEPLGKVEFSETPKILNISATPYEEYNYCLKDVKAVLFSTYHSGTLPTANEKFLKFCKTAKEQNVPMFVADASIEGMYKSIKVYKDLGIEVLKNTTHITAGVLIWMKNSRGEK